MLSELPWLFNSPFKKVFCLCFFKDIFYPLLFFFSPSGICMIRMLLCFTLSWSSLKLSSYFFSHFGNSRSTWVFLSTCLPAHYFSPLFHPACLSFLLVYFYFRNCILHFFLFLFIVSISFFMLFYVPLSSL